MYDPRCLALACLTGAFLFAACSDKSPAAPTPNVAERDVSGRIHESVPTESAGVAGATIAAVDALGATRTAVTDSSGKFTIHMAQGAAKMVVTADGYQPATISTAIADSGDLSIGLVPMLREIVITFVQGTLPADGPPNERRYRFAVHHRGELRASYTDSSAPSTAQMLTALEVRDGAGQMLWRTTGGYDVPARGAVLTVEPGMYDVRFFLTAGPSIQAWSGVIRHPN